MSCYCWSWCSLHRRTNAGIVWVSAPGDYATFNSNHTPDGTVRGDVDLSFGGGRLGPVLLQVSVRLLLPHDLADELAVLCHCPVERGQVAGQGLVDCKCPKAFHCVA